LTKEEWLFTLETTMTIQPVDVVDVVTAAAEAVVEEAVDMEDDKPTSQMRFRHRNECVLKEPSKKMTLRHSF
jgi:hypothetical protein